MTNALPLGLTNCLLWSDELGMGFHPRSPIVYAGLYFRKYQALDATEMGAELTAARVSFVKRHFTGSPVDIGIGGGRFVLEADTWGFDINPEAVKWLKAQERFLDVYAGQVEAITCWDSLEHIPDPAALVAQATEWVFVSMPVYLSQWDCLRSKHYKPGEHLYYWTQPGLIRWFAEQGFGCVEVNEIESDIGREGITSFAFRRFK